MVLARNPWFLEILEKKQGFEKNIYKKIGFRFARYEARFAWA